MSNDEKSANQFISALVKNLQAVCHGHVEFNKNVKVVGHLYLTVDSNSEFNYIVNEKVSKSDESSTTFISKSFYATDPQQKTPKKNVDRPLPSPTPNVLGKTRYDISVDLTDDPPQGTMGGGRHPQMLSHRGQFSRPQGFPGSQSFNRNPQMRRRPFDQNRLAPHQMAKMPRLSSPQRHTMNFPSTSPRKMPQSPHRIPSIMTSPIKPSIPGDLQTVTSIPPESVSATPAQSLPGADQPEINSSISSDKPDIKFEIIKVENGSVVASSNKSSTEGDDGELRIESVASHDLSQVPERSSPEKDSETKNSETSESDKPSDPAPETDPLESDKSELVTPEHVSSEHMTPEHVASELVTSELVTSEMAESESKEENTEAQNKTPPSKEHEVIEIDLTTVKDEIDSVLDSDSSYMFESGHGQHRFSSGQGPGDNSMSSFGGESNDDDFFASLREQTVGLYPVGLHANESNNPGQSFSDIPNLPGAHSQGAYMPVPGTSTSSSSNQPAAFSLAKNQCLWCREIYEAATDLTKHETSVHGIFDGNSTKPSFKCIYCEQICSSKRNLKEHIQIIHMKFRVKCPLCEKSYTRKIQLKYHFVKEHQSHYLRKQ